MINFVQSVLKETFFLNKIKFFRISFFLSQISIIMKPENKFELNLFDFQNDFLNKIHFFN